MNKVSVFQIKCIGSNILSLKPHPFCSIAGKDGIVEKGDDKERKVVRTKKPSVLVDASKNVKKQDGKRTTFQDSTVYSADELGRNRVKGRVKEFIKIFNQGPSQKPKDNNDIDFGIQSSKGKKRDTYGVVNEISIGTPGLDENTLRAQVSTKVPNISIMVELLCVHSNRY